MFGNIPPFGYNREKLKNGKGYILSINPEEAFIVKEIFNAYCIENNTINSVTQKLNKIGLKPRNSLKWSNSTVKDILSNPVYIGKIVWNRRKQQKKTKNGKIIITRPRNTNYLVFDGLHEPIIKNDIWQLAQKKRKTNAPKIHKNNEIKNPLAGIVLCAKCGRKMQRRPYRTAAKEDVLMCSNPKCDNVSSKLRIVEEKIIESLKLEFRDYKINFENLKKFDEIENNFVINIEKNIKKEKARINKIYEFFEEGIYNKNEFLSRIKNSKAQIANLQNSLNEYKNVRKPKNNFIEYQNIIELYDKMHSAEEKNIFLKTIISKITYLKTEKLLKKDDDFTNFEINIFPLLIPKLHSL